MIERSLISKVPPHNIEAEQACLGCMLLTREAVDEAIGRLKVDDFYEEAHRIIYKAIIELANKSLPVDLVTVTSYLRDKNQLEEIGGIEYLNTLLNTVPTTSNFEYYSRIVIEKSILRKLIGAANQIIASAYMEGVDVTEVLDQAEKLIFEIKNKQIRQDFVRIGDIIRDIEEQIRRLAESHDRVTGLPSGIKSLDDITAGFQKSDLIIIAARPSVGKTSLALNIAEYVAVEKSLPVAIFSLEMSKEQIMIRLLGSYGNLNIKNLRTGYIHESEWERLHSAVTKLSEAPIYIDDTPGISVMELKAKARRAYSKYGIQLIIVDYLQLVTFPGKRENKNQEISEISRALKELARELHIPVIVLSQLSRHIERRTNQEPRLSDLRESGAIEQDADVVIFIHREGELPEEAERDIICELIVAKHRNGPVGKKKVIFKRSYTKFGDIDEAHSEIIERAIPDY